ncbi:hypothetical protein M0802_008177 [Mischocyttarus mexicanus]|nr:hypothetical protein M0802_008177 [Mischocyttarus mexicanus]
MAMATKSEREVRRVGCYEREKNGKVLCEKVAKSVRTRKEVVTTVAVEEEEEEEEEEENDNEKERRIKNRDEEEEEKEEEEEERVGSGYNAAATFGAVVAFKKDALNL